ncbi:MAG: ACP S-malonyltransferase [Alphaproteobacteria bacterium]
MTRAFIFPGQGSHWVGMGRALGEAFAPARLVFDEVDETLSQKLSKLMWEGPDADLTLTENAQPAIMANSLAVIRVLQGMGLDLARHARLLAGHSLGEYSALCAAGAFTLPETARILKIRGQAMQSAVPVNEGAMAALIGIEIDGAEATVKDAASEGIVVVANDNAPGQIVISGEKRAVEKACEIAKQHGAKRVIPLNVSAPFHSPLMQPAAERMREALAQLTIRPPDVPILANVSAAEASEPETIRRLLVLQVTGRVRWRESVAAFRSFGISTTVEAGGNKVLTGMVKRIDKELEAISLDTPADIESFAKQL